MRRLTPGGLTVLARCLFGLFIFTLSVLTLLHYLAGRDPDISPPWLVPLIAGAEAISAAAFTWRPSALALAGLCSTFSAAAAVHLARGEDPWPLLGFGLAAILLQQLHAYFDRAQRG
jgi:hypothetical protein